MQALEQRPEHASRATRWCGTAAARRTPCCPAAKQVRAGRSSRRWRPRWRACARRASACRSCRRCAGSSRRRSRPAAAAGQRVGVRIGHALARGRRPRSRSSGSSAGGAPSGAVGRSASSARAPVARAIVRACSHTDGSSSGPAATITRAPARRTSSVACSDDSAGLIGAKIPAASAASSSGSSSAQLTRDDRDGVAALARRGRRARSPARWTSAASSPNVRCTRRLPALGVGQHRHRGAVAPQLGGARDELVGAGRQPALGERDALDLGEVGGAAEARPQLPGRSAGGIAHAVTASARRGASPTPGGRVAASAIGKPVSRNRSGGGPPHWLIVPGPHRPVLRLVAVALHLRELGAALDHRAVLVVEVEEVVVAGAVAARAPDALAAARGLAGGRRRGRAR